MASIAVSPRSSVSCGQQADWWQSRIADSDRAQDPDLLSVAGGLPLQVVDVAEGVAALGFGQVVAVGAAAAGRLPGMFPKQLAVLEDLDQPAVSARPDVLAEASAGDRG
jgi:hypothetical protein